MKRIVRILHSKRAVLLLTIFSAMVMVLPPQTLANTPPEPVVAIHVSELTQALETIPAKAPTPAGSGTTGYEWWLAEWHYFVMAESLKEALRSDGTPFIEVSDADIAAGRLLRSDGSPRYPILISLASEAVADNEVAPLREYVLAGGFLFAGSSAFTRNPDGTTRGDFALADEMGLHMATARLQNWYKNLHFSKIADHRLAAGIPAGTIAWRMPLSSEEIPLGVSPNHSMHGSHWVFQVSASGGATVIANGDTGPLLATTQYGDGNFIYHGAMQPLIGHTIYDPSLYAYLIYRHAIEWAFEAAGLPLVRLSPWPYEYDAAFSVRHDFENDAASIGSIENSASYEHSLGVKGNYYFCTGTLREEMPNKNTVIAGLRSAVTNYGATIGSHNGGLKNPVNLTLSIGDFDYWHWGPDEVLNITPPGYASGKAYAESSISSSFQDIEGWLSGVDNGRAGCGSEGNCPRTWVAPYFNSAREDSYDIVENTGAVATMGEQKISPFPHWTLSYDTPGRRFSHISIPASDWYVGAEIPGALEWGHTTDSMQAAVDFYHSLGASIELYGHTPSNDSNLMGQYVGYSVSKPRMWTANAVEIFEWWQARSNAIVTPAYGMADGIAVARAVISGTPGPGTAIEVAIPNMADISGLQVYIDGAPADPADYRAIGNTVKVHVGAATSTAEVRYTVSTDDNPVPTLADLSPLSITAGSPAFTLTVNGSNFLGASAVQWNGASRATTYVSSTRLTAAIPAADIAVAGTAVVTVLNPAPGGGVSNAQTFTINNDQAGGTWTQTDWVGGGGQSIWADQTRYDSSVGIDNGNNGEISLSYGSTELFSDDFSDGTLSPWVAALGTWSVTGGVMRGTGSANQYSYAYYSPASQWTDYSVQGRIQLPAGSFGGGIGGRVNASTGAHYGAWVYPTGSAGGSNMLKLWKFRGWTNLGAGAAMQQISLPAVGTGWHTLQMTFTGNRIQVYYDGVLKIDVTDTNFDSRPPYASGGISADWWTWSLPYTITVDDISVVTPTAYNSSGSLLSSAYDGGDGVQWQNVSWDGNAGASANVCVKTRTADSSDQIVNATWSNCYSTSGSSILSENRRWIQYRLELTTSDTSTSPVFNEIRIPYQYDIPGAPVPVLSSLTPASAAAGGSAFALTVNGSGFAADSVVQWNGMDRTTTYLSAAQLTAAISASDLATAGTITVTVFTPAPGGGTSNTQTFMITKATPVIFWADPADITYGTALSGTQLNATANTDGSFVYDPKSGTILSAGAGQTLSVTFTPTDAANYNTAAASVLINVIKVPLSEILWRNTATGDNAVWYMDGETLTGSAFFTPIYDPNWQIVGTGDFNGDAKPDILWRNSATGDNAVWYMDGITMTAYAFLDPITDQNWKIVGTGDFNSDTKPDILWRNSATGDNAVWYMDGITMTAYAFLDPITDQNWKIVGTGDFNSDTKSDILWRNSATGDNAVWYMDGITMTAYAFLDPITDQNWKIVGTGDFNSDTKSDILWRNSATGDNAVWYMDGITMTAYAFLDPITDQNWKIVGQW